MTNAGSSADEERAGEKLPLVSGEKVTSSGCDLTFGAVAWVEDLSDKVGYKLLVILFFVEHVMRGFVDALSKQSANFVYGAYNVPGPTISIYSGVVSLPWALKPIIGLVSDLVPVGGYNKMPYMLLTSLGGCIAYFCIGFMPQHILPVTAVVACLLFAALQMSTCDILAEAKYAEKIREVPAYGPHILSYVWFGMNFGDVIGTGMSGVVIELSSAKIPYAIAMVPAFLVMFPIAMNYLQENVVSAEEMSARRARFYKQKEACFLCVMMFAGIMALTYSGLSSHDTSINCWVAGTIFVVILLSFSVVLSPTIAAFNAWSFIQASCSVSTGGAAFYFMTDDETQYPEGPHFSTFFYTSVMGTVVSIVSLVGIVTYQKYASAWRYRTLLVIINVVLGLFNFLDMIFYSRLNVRMGIPDHVFVLGTSVFANILSQWQWMPQVIILSYLCPKGMEATMYALLAGCHNLGNVIAANFGALLLDNMGIRPNGSTGESAQFENLWKASFISSLLPLIPIVLLFKLIPDVRQGDSVIEPDEDATTGSLLNKWMGD